MRCRRLTIPIAVFGLLVFTACGDDTTGPTVGTLRYPG